MCVCGPHSPPIAWPIDGLTSTLHTQRTLETHTFDPAEMFNERGAVYEFTNLVKELETAGVLYSDKVQIKLNMLAALA